MGGGRVDIHAPLTGDLSSELFDLSYEVCYDHMLQYLITIGDYQEDTPQLLHAWLAEIKDFPCGGHRRISRRVR